MHINLISGYCVFFALQSPPCSCTWKKTSKVWQCVESKWVDLITTLSQIFFVSLSLSQRRWGNRDAHWLFLDRCERLRDQKNSRDYQSRKNYINKRDERLCCAALCLYIWSLMMSGNRYNLYPEAVNAGLPLIDTRRTLIDRFCPAYLKRPKCAVKRYREYNGMCNNLENAHWGATLAPYRRLIPAAYADGNFIHIFTINHNYFANDFASLLLLFLRWVVFFHFLHTVQWEYPDCLYYASNVETSFALRSVRNSSLQHTYIYIKWWVFLLGAYTRKFESWVWQY